MVVTGSRLGYWGLGYWGEGLARPSGGNEMTARLHLLGLVEKQRRNRAWRKRGVIRELLRHAEGAS